MLTTLMFALVRRSGGLPSAGAAGPAAEGRAFPPARPVPPPSNGARAGRVVQIPAATTPRPEPSLIGGAP